MTEHVGFLKQLPVRAVLDGELVAFGDDGKPDFECVCMRMLHRNAGIPLTFIAFDVLSVEGLDLRREPYHQRRNILEELQVDGPQWKTPERFADGDALWVAVCEHELEGVVAKRLNEPYLSGERSWIKTKNRSYWRWELERESAFRQRRAPATV